VDLMATIVDVTARGTRGEFKGRAIQPMEGVSLRPAFAGGRISRTQPIFWEHEGNRRFARAGGSSSHGTGWMGALRHDRRPRRAQRLARTAPDVVRKLAAEWEAWAKRANVDRWPGPRLTNWGDPLGKISSARVRDGLEPVSRGRSS
jgi:arylsulfatase